MAKLEFLMFLKSQRDALIISCDLVGDLPIQKVLDLHGLKDSAFTSLYMKGQEVPAGVQLPGPRSKFVPGRISLEKKGR